MSATKNQFYHELFETYESDLQEMNPDFELDYHSWLIKEKRIEKIIKISYKLWPKEVEEYYPN
jgi:hypothetical protein